MTSSNQVTTSRTGAIWAPAALLLFAAGLLTRPFPFTSPVSDATEVPKWATDATPERQPRFQPLYSVAGYTYRCNDCHKIIPQPAETPHPLTRHREIDLEHGINTRCFNCHHPTNRDAFVDDYGREIPWNQPQLLCGKCHGPVYRDWQHGSHGRINGYWDVTRGEQVRRRCIECHDPHRPPFLPLALAPGPNTLRMGPQSHGDHAESHGPLRLRRTAGVSAGSQEKD